MNEKRNEPIGTGEPSKLTRCRRTARVLGLVAYSGASADSRGIARPLDGDNDVSVVCDIGAVELRNDVVLGSGFE